MDEDIKDYLSSNFTSGMSNNNNNNKRPTSLKTPHYTPSLLLPSSVPHGDDSCSVPSMERKAERMMKYMPRATLFENRFHKYAPCTMMTMMYHESAALPLRVYACSRDDDSLAIPVIDQCVQHDHDDAPPPRDVLDDSYIKNVQRDIPGIESFVGEYRDFIEQYGRNAMEFPTIYVHTGSLVSDGDDA